MKVLHMRAMKSPSTKFETAIPTEVEVPLVFIHNSLSLLQLQLILVVENSN
jgi:hypothetical protein